MKYHKILYLISQKRVTDDVYEKCLVELREEDVIPNDVSNDILLVYL